MTEEQQIDECKAAGNSSRRNETTRKKRDRSKSSKTKSAIDSGKMAEEKVSPSNAELVRFQLQVMIARKESDFVMAKEIGAKVLDLLIADKSVTAKIAGHYFYLMSIVDLWLGDYTSARQNCKKALCLFESLSGTEIRSVFNQFQYVKNLRSRLLPCTVSIISAFL